MPLFDIDYGSLVPQKIPVRLRQSVMIAWLKALVSPVKWLYGVFMAFRAACLYNLAHDGQVCYLQAALNDTFDPVTRGIYITDATYVDPLYVYLADEDKPVYIDLDSEIGTSVIPDPDPVPLYLDSEVYAFGGVTFIVHVPVAVVFDTNRMRALIDKYRLVGKTYSIVTF